MVVLEACSKRTTWMPEEATAGKSLEIRILGAD
jgi:hypothetical protein